MNIVPKKESWATKKRDKSCDDQTHKGIIHSNSINNSNSFLPAALTGQYYLIVVVDVVFAVVVWVRTLTMIISGRPHYRLGFTLGVIFKIFMMGYGWGANLVIFGLFAQFLCFLVFM